MGRADDMNIVYGVKRSVHISSSEPSQWGLHLTGVMLVSSQLFLVRREDVDHVAIGVELELEGATHGATSTSILDRSQWFRRTRLAATAEYGWFLQQFQRDGASEIFFAHIQGQLSSHQLIALRLLPLSCLSNLLLLQLRLLLGLHGRKLGLKFLHLHRKLIGGITSGSGGLWRPLGHLYTKHLWHVVVQWSHNKMVRVLALELDVPTIERMQPRMNFHVPVGFKILVHDGEEGCIRRVEIAVPREQHESLPQGFTVGWTANHVEEKLVLHRRVGNGFLLDHGPTMLTKAIGDRIIGFEVEGRHGFHSGRVITAHIGSERGDVETHVVGSRGTSHSLVQVTVLHRTHNIVHVQVEKAFSRSGGVCIGWELLKSSILLGHHLLFILCGEAVPIRFRSRRWRRWRRWL